MRFTRLAVVMVMTAGLAACSSTASGPATTASTLGGRPAFSRTAPGGRQVRAYRVPVPCGTSIRVEVTKNGRWRNEGLVPIPAGYRQQALSLVLYAPLDGVVIAYVQDPSATVSWKDGSDTLDAMKPIGGWVVDVAAHPPASLPDNGGVGELVLAGPNGPGRAVPVHSVVPPPRPDGC